MGDKRKRKQDSNLKSRKSARIEIREGQLCSKVRPAHNPTLNLYYPYVSSLQDYLHSRLQIVGSKARLRRLHIVANRAAQTDACDDTANGAQRYIEICSDQSLGSLLRETLVCHGEESSPLVDLAISHDFAAYSQQSPSIKESSIEEGTVSQTEVRYMQLISL